MFASAFKVLATSTSISFDTRRAITRILGRLSGPIWITTPHGYLFKYYPDDATSFMGAFSLYQRVFEEVAGLKEGMRFVDIGCNAGAICLFAARRVGIQGHCYAFDANPEMIARLIENARRNDFTNIHAFPFAVSSETRMLGFRSCYSHTGAGYLSESGDQSFSSLAFNLSDLPATLISKIVETKFWIKIDVEGHELRVLKGARVLLENCNCERVIIEISEQMLARESTSEGELFEEMAKHGFSVISPPPSQRGSHYDAVFGRT